MKQLKIAISLAVIAAIATPFASGTYEAEPFSKTFVPLSKEGDARIRAYLAKTDNCKTHLETVIEGEGSLFNEPAPQNWIALVPKFNEVPPALSVCKHNLELWRTGGYVRYGFSLSKYLAINAAAVVAAFAVVFGSSYLFLALGRRYWRWLNT